MEEAKWYVLHTFSGYENVAKENLENVIQKFNLQERIFDIIIPMEESVEEDKNGKQKVVQRKLMPSYLIVKMIYGDDIWHNITRTRGITGFVGPKGRPLALTEAEIEKLKLERPTSDIELQVNQKVEIIDGPLEKFVGFVMTVDNERKQAKLMVEMFGRETPVTVEFNQIKIID